MARTYTPVGWQDGEVIEPAKVTVAGTEYEVEPKVVVGNTPVNATNLKKMDNEIKKIIEEDIPETLNVELKAVTDVEPSECAAGDKYFNTTTNMIYTAVATDTWDTTGETPIVGILYVIFSEQTTYAYDGTTLISVGGGTDNSGGETLKIGCIIPFSGTNAPDGYLLCDGSAVSRTTYADLFNAIGVTYGAGDGSTTFNLPNLKGKVPVGLDSNDTDFDNLGETGGEKTHTLTVNEMPEHNHSVFLDETGSGGKWGPTGTVQQSTNRYTTTGNTGGDQAHNNMQPYLVVNYIIKAMNTTPIQAQIMSSYSTSVTDGYCCDYINNAISTATQNNYSTSEIKTNKLWIDGKPLYRKTLTKSSSGDIDISSLNIEQGFIDFNHSITHFSTLGGINRIVPIVETSVSNIQSQVGAYFGINYEKITIEAGSAVTLSDVIVTIEYTKTTD